MAQPRPYWTVWEQVDAERQPHKIYKVKMRFHALFFISSQGIIIHTMQYQEYLKSPDWAQKRSIKRSKQNRCAICASTTDILDVHHLNYKNLFDVEQSDLRVLCRTCHFTVHDLMKAKMIHFKPNASHHSKFTTIKNAVKRARGLGWGNLFYPKPENKDQLKLL